MRQPIGHKLFWLMMTTILVISCDISSLAAPTSLPAAGPGAVNTIVAQTAAAAATQTSASLLASGPAGSTSIAKTANAAATQTAAMFTPTVTPTVTPYLTQTPSDTPTATVTFVFFLMTPTETPGAASGHKALWSCQILGQVPANNVHFAPNTQFKTTWTVKNTSTTNWVATNINIQFAGGTNLASESAFDTVANVPIGGSEALRISMQAPAEAGTYTSKWTLISGKTDFCPLSVVIIVP